MILLIDNYDSFSYNLYQLVGTLNPDITVIRNDEKSVEEIARMAPERIILSPGPGYPAAAASASRSSEGWESVSRFSAYASGIRQSVRLTERGLRMRSG